jgi:hypothetical protein
MPEISRKPTVDKTVPEDRINMTKLQSLFPARVIYIGRISGQRYVFPEAGSVLEVDSRDVDDMLAYRIGTTNCCGGGNPDGNRVFQTV